MTDYTNTADIFMKAAAQIYLTHCSLESIMKAALLLRLLLFQHGNHFLLKCIGEWPQTPRSAQHNPCHSVTRLFFVFLTDKTALRQKCCTSGLSGDHLCRTC